MVARERCFTFQGTAPGAILMGLYSLDPIPALRVGGRWTTTTRQTLLARAGLLQTPGLACRQQYLATFLLGRARRPETTSLTTPGRPTRTRLSAASCSSRTAITGMTMASRVCRAVADCF